MAIIDQAFTVYGGTASKPTTKNLAPDKSWNPTDNLPYKGNLLIAYRPDYAAILSSLNQHLMGVPPTEEVVRKNLEHSQNNSTSYVNANASAL